MSSKLLRSTSLLYRYSNNFITLKRNIIKKCMMSTSVSAAPAKLTSPDHITINPTDPTFDLALSLAADSITSRGSILRNASVHELLAHLPRNAYRSADKVAILNGGAGKSLPLHATDALRTVDSVVDVEVFQANVKEITDNALSFAPTLFVTDGAIGSSRETEIRTRFITDDPAMALVARAVLHRTPLYAAQVFPRTVTVYAATKVYVSRVSMSCYIVVLFY
jgi:hypothetical protein